jgi:opacity protein-like surface antigen
MKMIVKTLMLSVVGLVAFANLSSAADLMEPVYEEVPEIVPVEVGSGWYLRGDVSYDFKSDSEGTYRTYAAPGAGCDVDNSCGTGYDKQDYDQWDIDEAVNVGVGFGYQFTDYFRGDLTAHYWSADVDGRDEGGCGELCGSVETSKADAWELMANAYVDMGTFAGFTPYVGAGLGGVHIKYDDFKTKNFNETGFTGTDTLYGEESWRFAYALMAGVSYDLTTNLKLDAGYRFVDVDGGDMFSHNEFGNVDQGKDDGFQRHTIQAGLRYSLF